VDDRRALNTNLGLAVRRNSGAICRTALANKCYNRFVRWRMAGTWDQMMHALAVGAQMVDTSIVHVHKQGVGIAANGEH
jgi:hypothetical protein